VGRTQFIWETKLIPRIKANLQQRSQNNGCRGDGFREHGLQWRREKQVGYWFTRSSARNYWSHLQVNPNIVLVLNNGRPLAIPWAAENIPAIVEGWHLERKVAMQLLKLW
jgi:beta-glucosidase